MSKPRLFIASSVESLPIAEAVNVNLDHNLEVTIWKNGTFKLSSSTIDDLVTKSSMVDFALFIFAPDDISTIRNEDKRVVRDNVIFELGLFVGSIGKSRSFILKPRDTDMHLPTDLLGLTLADYEANRSDRDLVSATNKACYLIKSEVERLGAINHTIQSGTTTFTANPASYELTAQDYRVLSTCLKSQTAFPYGLSFYQIGQEHRRTENYALSISIIKLERLNLINKTVEVGTQHGEEYYAYSITEQGVDELLKNENKFQAQKPAPSQPFDEDIPF